MRHQRMRLLQRLGERLHRFAGLGLAPHDERTIRVALQRFQCRVQPIRAAMGCHEVVRGRTDQNVSSTPLPWLEHDVMDLDAVRWAVADRPRFITVAGDAIALAVTAAEISVVYVEKVLPGLLCMGDYEIASPQYPPDDGNAGSWARLVFGIAQRAANPLRERTNHDIAGAAPIEIARDHPGLEPRRR